MTTPLPKIIPAISVTEEPSPQWGDDYPEGIVPDDSSCLSCDAGVGVVLVGDYDTPTWRTPWSVRRADNDALIGFLCEDCASVIDGLDKATSPKETS